MTAAAFLVSLWREAGEGSDARVDFAEGRDIFRFFAAGTAKRGEGERGGAVSSSSSEEEDPYPARPSIAVIRDTCPGAL